MPLQVQQMLIIVFILDLCSYGKNVRLYMHICVLDLCSYSKNERLYHVCVLMWQNDLCYMIYIRCSYLHHQSHQCDHMSGITCCVHMCDQ